MAEYSTFCVRDEPFFLFLSRLNDACARARERTSKDRSRFRHIKFLSKRKRPPLHELKREKFEKLRQNRASGETHSGGAWFVKRELLSGVTTALCPLLGVLLLVAQKQLKKEEDAEGGEEEDKGGTGEEAEEERIGE
ncbi:hypothetical protein L596_001441 [Steinernema carpocapsae]|uniref:Uncharacterized protein n=1 Tax=Steinernema carpocapsae TaxID=34508 RepID=A0A4U8UQA3_STECR|nr:hypothetical protein L596_001441 [Steinernema carpocapsae]